MNQTPLTNSSMKINSQHYINALEGTLIQITRALAMEHSIRPDPEAKAMARTVAQDKVNLLLSNEERENIRRLWDQTVSDLKSVRSNNDEVGQYLRDVYELMKTMGLDNV